MKVYVVNCTFNTSQILIDCAFKNEADANAYAAAFNSDKAKAVARCKELIALREGESWVKFLSEDSMITFEVLAVDLK